MFNRILLAVDGTESGDVAISFVSAMARRYSADVKVVYVNEFLVGGRGMTASTEPQARRIVDDAVVPLWGAGIEVEGEVLLGNCFTIDSRIVESARDFSADVIVLGSRRQRRLPRLMSRGLRERVTSLTALPVIAAPAPLKVTSRQEAADLLLASLVEESRVAHGAEAGNTEAA
jgi:nucleotide-binding universal stress UspA family protein